MNQGWEQELPGVWNGVSQARGYEAEILGAEQKHGLGTDGSLRWMVVAEKQGRITQPGKIPCSHYQLLPPGFEPPYPKGVRQKYSQNLQFYNTQNLDESWRMAPLHPGKSTPRPEKPET